MAGGDLWEEVGKEVVGGGWRLGDDGGTKRGCGGGAERSEERRVVK